MSWWLLKERETHIHGILWQKSITLVNCWSWSVIANKLLKEHDRSFLCLFVAESWPKSRIGVKYVVIVWKQISCRGNSWACHCQVNVNVSRKGSEREQLKFRYAWWIRMQPNPPLLQGTCDSTWNNWNRAYALLLPVFFHGWWLPISQIHYTWSYTTHLSLSLGCAVAVWPS